MSAPDLVIAARRLFDSEHFCDRQAVVVSGSLIVDVTANAPPGLPVTTLRQVRSFIGQNHMHQPVQVVPSS